MLRRKKLISVVLLMLFVAGCGAHRANTTNPAPITTIEQLNYDNAQISIHNRAIAKSLIAINQAGFLGDREYFDKLSRAQIAITRAHRDVSPLLKDIPTALANGDKVKALLDVMQTQANQMIADGTAGIKNAESKQSFLADVQSVRSAVESLYTILEASGLKK